MKPLYADDVQHRMLKIISGNEGTKLNDIVQLEILPDYLSKKIKENPAILKQIESEFDINDPEIKKLIGGK